MRQQEKLKPKTYKVLVPSLRRLYRGTLTVEEEVQASNNLLRFVAILTEIDQKDENQK